MAQGRWDDLVSFLRSAIPFYEEPGRIRVRLLRDAGAPGDGQAGSGRAFNPHVFTLRSGDLVWLGAGHTRGYGALDTFGLFDRYTGTLVSDDYNGYAKYQVRLTARQLCNAHLIRSAKGVAEAEPRRQAWAAAMIEVLRAGRKSVTDAVAAGCSALAGQEIEQIRAAYREQAQAGITANRGVGKTAVTRYTRLRCPRSGAVLRAGWGSSADPGTWLIVRGKY